MAAVEWVVVERVAVERVAVEWVAVESQYLAPLLLHNPHNIFTAIHPG